MVEDKKQKQEALQTKEREKVLNINGNMHTKHGEHLYNTTPLEGSALEQCFAPFRAFFVHKEITTT